MLHTVKQCIYIENYEVFRLSYYGLVNLIKAAMQDNKSYNCMHFRRVRKGLCLDIKYLVSKLCVLYTSMQFRRGGKELC